MTETGDIIGDNDARSDIEALCRTFDTMGIVIQNNEANAVAAIAHQAVAVN